MSKKRKTRQEKKISDLRRQLETTKTNDYTLPPQETSEAKIQPRTYQLPVIQSSAPQKTTQSQPNIFPVAYIKRDLSKTLILALLAFSLELVLYFVLG
ncbi:MAG: hypothetical protein Q7S03_01040 [bacterium]|nr:hypothetical protein [bacterium]